MKALILAAAAVATAIGSAQAKSGVASHYSTRELGTRTAGGRPLHDGALTAAHRTLPFGSRVRVINRSNGWPAPGSEDTELGVLMELEVGHGETEVHAGIQA
jgi:hypothetical protein